MDQVIGALIEFVGTSISVCGLNGQKAAMMHAKLRASEDGVSLWNWRWVFAFMVFVIGQVSELSAQGFGTQELIATVSNFSLCTNALIARYCFFESLGSNEVIAISIILAGTIIAAMASPSLPENLDDYSLEKFLELFEAPVYLVFFCLLLGVLAACLVLMYRLPPREEQTRESGGAMIYAVTAATNGCFCVTLSSVFMKLFREALNGQDTFKTYASWAIGVGFFLCASLNFFFLNKGVRDYESMVIIPIYYVLNTVLSVIGGLLFYKTYRGFSIVTLPLFIFGEVLSVAGIALLSTRKDNSEDQMQRYQAQTDAFNRTFAEGFGEVRTLVRSLSAPDADEDGQFGELHNPLFRRFESAPPLIVTPTSIVDERRTRSSDTERPSPSPSPARSGRRSFTPSNSSYAALSGRGAPPPAVPAMNADSPLAGDSGFGRDSVPRAADASIAPPVTRIV